MNLLDNYFPIQIQNHPLKNDFVALYDQFNKLKDKFQLSTIRLFQGNDYENLLTYCFGLPLLLSQQYCTLKIWQYNKIIISLYDDIDINCVNFYAHNSFDRFGNEWLEAFKQFIDFIEEKIKGIP